MEGETEREREGDRQSGGRKGVMGGGWEQMGRLGGDGKEK